MRQKNILKLFDKNFKRMIVVKRQIFNIREEIILKALIVKKSKWGRPNKSTLNKF